MSEVTVKLEIIEVLSKYLLCLDERRFDSDSLGEVFTDNAEISVPSKIISLKKCSGLKEIRELHVALFRLIKSSHHQSSDFVFLSLSDNVADVRCNLTAYFNSFNDEFNIATGFIKFSVIKTDNGWRIKKMNRKTRISYCLMNYSKNQEIF